MTGEHGVSLKPCSEVNYAFRKREGVIENLERCAQFTVKNGVFRNTLGALCSPGYLKQPLIFFNNQESIVSRGCFGTPHF